MEYQVKQAHKLGGYVDVISKAAVSQAEDDKGK